MLRAMLFALAMLVCIAAAENSRSCLHSYAVTRGSKEVCGIVNDGVVLDLARNCTDGDVRRAHAALAAFCLPLHVDDTEPSNPKSSSRKAPPVRAPRATKRASSPGSRAPSATSAANENRSKLDMGRYLSAAYYLFRSSSPPQGTSCSSAVVRNSIFSEGSVIFAMTGLLLTTLTSFIFL